MSNQIVPRTLKGFRDILPAEAIVKNRMKGKLVSIFESFGFNPIETPHIELTECLFGESGPEIQKQVFRFTDNGGRDVSLRFDLTVPLARFAAQHNHEIGMPFKRWVIGECFRGENPQAGRYREFTQCDFDIVGTVSLCADAEILQVICSAMQALKVPSFQISINNRKIMNGFISALGHSVLTPAIMIEIDKLDKVSVEEVQRALCEKVGLSAEDADKLLTFVQVTNDQSKSNQEIFNALAGYSEQHHLIADGLRELQEVCEILARVGIAEPVIRVDLSIARGLGYYTGIVYETRLTCLPEIGSVCSGGRYDNLTQTFQKEPCPGVGASVGIDRLIAALTKLNLLESTGTPAKVLVTRTESRSAGDCALVAAELRSDGVPTELYPDCDKMKKQVAYAKRAGHPFLVVAAREGPGWVLERVGDGSRVECASIESLKDEFKKLGLSSAL